MSVLFVQIIFLYHMDINIQEVYFFICCFNTCSLGDIPPITLFTSIISVVLGALASCIRFTSWNDS